MPDRSICPYLRNKCPIAEKHAETDLCTKRYGGCAGYTYAMFRGVEAIRPNMSPIDYALMQKGVEPF